MVLLDPRLHLDAARDLLEQISRRHGLLEMGDKYPSRRRLGRGKILSRRPLTLFEVEERPCLTRQTSLAVVAETACRLLSFRPLSTGPPATV